jgi:hypothetical protein
VGGCRKILLATAIFYKKKKALNAGKRVWVPGSKYRKKIYFFPRNKQVGLNWERDALSLTFLKAFVFIVAQIRLRLP